MSERISWKALYLRVEEGEEKGHADDGVEEYYDNDDQDKHYKGSD
jgi:hypothetical protein